MQEPSAELISLADYLGGQREAVLTAWQNAIEEDASLTSGHVLPRVQLLDHIPLLLATFEKELRAIAAGDVTDNQCREQRVGAAHGFERWKQSYELHEVARELGMLNECLVFELDRFATLNPSISHVAMSAARRAWARLCRTDIEASIAQYFALQQEEAARHVKELERALADMVEMERQRGELWRQAAHDIRGNLGVVANVAAGLGSPGDETSRNEFVRILTRNLTAFRHLIDDVTSLARLEAGHERRIIQPVDAASTIHQLCEGMRPIAAERQLYLRWEGPAAFEIEGDPVKIRRIAQNLILNGVKYTGEGGLTVTWGDSDPEDTKRWLLCIKDTGPGFVAGARSPSTGNGCEPGEGIGLSIVKRLCEMLDATIEMQSAHNVGTTFRILFPKHYPADVPSHHARVM